MCIRVIVVKTLFNPLEEFSEILSFNKINLVNEQQPLSISFTMVSAFLARLLILIKKGGLLQLKFGVVGVGVNIYLWAR